MVQTMQNHYRDGRSDHRQARTARRHPVADAVLVIASYYHGITIVTCG
jgi:hypothetical protein